MSRNPPLHKHTKFKLQTAGPIRLLYSKNMACELWFGYSMQHNALARAAAVAANPDEAWDHGDEVVIEHWHEESERVFNERVPECLASRRTDFEWSTTDEHGVVVDGDDHVFLVGVCIRKLHCHYNGAMPVATAAEIDAVITTEQRAALAVLAEQYHIAELPALHIFISSER